MSTDFDEEDRSSIIYPKAFYTWKSEIRYTGWYIGLLLREYLKYLEYRQNCSSGISIIIYSVDRLANKNLHHVFVKKKKIGVAKLVLINSHVQVLATVFLPGQILNRISPLLHGNIISDSFSRFFIPLDVSTKKNTLLSKKSLILYGYVCSTIPNTW